MTLLLFLASAVSPVMANHDVPKAYWVDVCLETNDPAACAREYQRKERIAYRKCANGRRYRRAKP